MGAAHAAAGLANNEIVGEPPKRQTDEEPCMHTSAVQFLSGGATPPAAATSSREDGMAFPYPTARRPSAGVLLNK
jgi:hypothetical protein